MLLAAKASARSLLVLALGIGVLGDVLLRATPAGAGASLWILALAAAAIVRRPGIATLGDPYPTIPLVIAAAFGLGFAWRDSPGIQALFGAAAFVAGATAFLDRPARAGVASHAIAPSAAVASATLAMPLVLSRARGRGRFAARRGLRIATAGALLAALPMIVFGSLFAAADPLFARYAGDLVESLDEAARHGAWILVSAWLVAGLLAGLALARLPADLELRSPRPAIGDALVVSLALVLALFAAFLAVQARALVGGHAFVEAQVGLSYAAYARQGFFQLLACAAIALPLLLGVDWAVGPIHPRRRRAVVLCLALVAAVLAVLASAARRMALYVEAYGLTELRVYASAIMIWLAIAFVAFAIAAARGSRDRFSLHALAAAGVCVLALGVLDPPAAIVRYNLGRAGGSESGFDAGYAGSLGADAVPELLDGLAGLPRAPRCELARALLARWREAGDQDWRSFNLSRSRARDELAASAGMLEAIARDCGSGAGAPRPRMHPAHDELAGVELERAQHAIGDLAVGEPARDALVDHEPEHDLAVADAPVPGELVPIALPHDGRAGRRGQDVHEPTGTRLPFPDRRLLQHARDRVQSCQRVLAHPGDRRVRSTALAQRRLEGGLQPLRVSVIAGQRRDPTRHPRGFGRERMQAPRIPRDDGDIGATAGERRAGPAQHPRPADHERVLALASHARPRQA
jgi:hypothetical protein